MRGHIAQAALDRALERTAKADRKVRSLLKRYRADSAGLMVLATGGYARGDLAPYSDLDLIIVSTDLDRHEPIVREFVQSLWDTEYTPAPTVVAFDELDAALFTVPDRASSMFESRFIWGDRKLAGLFQANINNVVDTEVFETFAERKQEEFTARRAKYGSVPRVIEPHLKNEAGGFRDIHHVFWLERAGAALRGKWKLRRNLGMMIQLFARRLGGSGQFMEWETTEFIEAFGFLLAVREMLHERYQRCEDRLIVGEQPVIGRKLGFVGDDRQVMIDLMRAVFHTTEKHSRFCDEFGYFFRLPQAFARHRKLSSGVSPQIHIKHGRFALDSELMHLYSSSPRMMMSFIDSTIESGIPLSGHSRHVFRRILHWQHNPHVESDPVVDTDLFSDSDPLERENPLYNIENWKEPLRIWFELASGLAMRLRRMDELDTIKLWLPEWHEIAGLTTGSYYHRYTVDEHTLRAMETLDKLGDLDTDRRLASLWDNYQFRPLVYLTLLCHDIAKGRGDDHTNKGAAIVLEALPRFGMGEWAERVAHLVRLHLLMEQIAFRRDITDPAVIQSFVEQVGDEQSLTALYIVTACDMSAVRDGVWTIWKARLLSELYFAARNVMRHGLDVQRGSVAEEVERVAPLLSEIEGGRDRAEEFLRGMQAEYRRAVPAAEIAQHLRIVEELQLGEMEFRWLIDRQSDIVILTLITHDRSGLLADVSGLLIAQGIGIREARIFTRADGVVIDRFRCEDIESTRLSIRKRLEQIPDLWSQLNSGQLNLEELLAQFQRRSRLERNKVGVVDPGVSVRPSIDGAVIDISGEDSIGLLYRLCSVLSDEGFEIRSARVIGRLDGILDSFLVKDPEGRLKATDQIEELKRKLREAADETRL